MAYENVQFNQPNFCIAPRTGEFCSIDHTQGTNGVLQIKTNNGVLQKTYDIDTSILSIEKIEYVGPRNLSLSFNQLGDKLPFFTLEHLSSTQARIRKWRLNNTSNSFDLETSTVFSNYGNYRFNSYTMAIECFDTEFSQATTTGTGRIKLSSYDNIEAGDELLLGPSSDADNQYAFEVVSVTSISGGWVYITSTSGVPPKNEYAAGDTVTYYKYLYLFSDTGLADDDKFGSLYKIDLRSNTISGAVSRGYFCNVRAASWSKSYQSIGFVKNSDLLYYNFDLDQISKAQSLNNINSDKHTILSVYDITFDDLAIYRLQDKITLADDNGNLSTTTWSTYNYHEDTISPYTKSITFFTIPDGIVLNDQQVTIKVVVRDQFGVGLNGKTVYFYDSPDAGEFSPINGQSVTNANGVATIVYDVNYFDINGTDDNNIFITIKARTDGASTLTGSQYVWDKCDLLLMKRIDSIIYLNQKLDRYELDTYLKQLEDYSIDIYLRSLSKFQFPGGNWVGNSAPSDSTTIIKQLEDFESIDYVTQLDPDFLSDVYLDQKEDKTNDLLISQLYVSKHKSSGNSDTAIIDQFRFIDDASPPFWSEKNPVNTDISIRLRPFAFSLNQSTLKFKVRELSYAGDTGYIDVTSLCNISTFDAGGGLLGLDIFYNPQNDFHHNAIIYVYIEVYDTAPLPNIIVTDYWFKIIPDYKSPYIVNESPFREEKNVDLDTAVSFDILDSGVGVDIDSLEVYINNSLVNTSISSITNGYRIVYIPTVPFKYGETVEVSVVVEDESINKNILYDNWRFYCKKSTGPWIDPESFSPKSCSKGLPRKISTISANIYAVDGTGIDKDSILVYIGGRKRKVTIIPIVYRLK